MAYSITGTNSADNLNQTTEPGPGTINGLGGDDHIFSGTGEVTVNGGSGNDMIVLQIGNTASVFGASENDSITFAPFLGGGGTESGTALSPGQILLFGNEGADTIDASEVDFGVTIVGGNNSSDGNDTLVGSGGDDVVFGNGGNDTMTAHSGNDTYVGGAGGDLIGDFPFFEGSKVPEGFSAAAVAGVDGNDLVFGNEGNDTIEVSPGNDTVFGGQGNDIIGPVGFEPGLVSEASVLADLGGSLYFGNEGNDTINAFFAETPVTIVGGNDCADGADLLFGSFFGDIIFGNGGNNSIDAAEGDDTVVGGTGNDTMFICDGNNLAFGNEGNDTIQAEGDFADTVFAGQGNDLVLSEGGRDTVQGNEGNDTIEGCDGIDTISGGSGNDAFQYTAASDDGDNATGGGPVEFIIDVNFDQDRFLTVEQVTFAANMGPGTGGTLAASANNAIAAALALSGDPDAIVAAQFTFGGRVYLAIDQQAGASEGTVGGFDDATDLLIDITGAVGTIGANDFGPLPVV